MEKNSDIGNVPWRTQNRDKLLMRLEELREAMGMCNVQPDS